MHISREQLLEELARIEQRYSQLEQQVAESSGTRSDPQAYQQLSKALSDLRETAMAYRTYLKIEREAAEADAIFRAQGDLEVRQMAKEEAAALRQQQIELLIDRLSKAKSNDEFLASMAKKS